MKNILIIFALLLLFARAASAQELTPGITFADGQRLTAAQLAQLVAQAKINPAFYTDKVSQTNVAPTDILLVYSPSSGTFHQVTGAAGIFGNPSIISGQVEYPSIAAPDYYFLGYDQSNNILFQVNSTNLFGSAGPAIIGGATPYVPTQPDFLALNTTNMIQFFIWDTNNALHRISGTNFLYAIAPTLGTNVDVPYAVLRTFKPWTIYGTNSVTNAFGINTNFPITTVTFTNGTQLNFSDSDQIPINSTPQGTNTTATLGALYGYITNKIALPPYTQARIQFSGNPVLFAISNNANTTFDSIFVTNTGFASSPAYPALASPYAVGFCTNGSSFYFNGAQSNTLYYVVPFATNANWMRIFTNYATAVAQTNWLDITAAGAGTNFMTYCTNFTSLNADVTTVTARTNVLAGIFDVWFRTPSVNNLYYVTGSALNDVAGSGKFVSIQSSMIITTNEVRIAVADGGSGTSTNSRLVQVLISPQ